MLPELIAAKVKVVQDGKPSRKRDCVPLPDPFPFPFPFPLQLPIPVCFWLVPPPVGLLTARAEVALPLESPEWESPPPSGPASFLSVLSLSND